MKFVGGGGSESGLWGHESIQGKFQETRIHYEDKM